MPMLRRLFQPTVLVCAMASVFAASAQATELTVYTAVESDDLQNTPSASTPPIPTITINWVRDSTGVITARLLAEKRT
ncbi:phosphonate ABC transporter substrate-binding protein, partial [Halomonas sp. SUBG004]